MLGHRIISALVMLPLVVGAVWLGGPVFDSMTAFCAVVMAWEWNAMVKGRFGGAGFITALAGAGAVMVAATYPLIALLVAGGGAVIAGLVGRGSVWLAAGTLYIALPCTALVWLRAVHGLETLLWLFLVVWVTDIGAYSVGRWIGGPRLAPAISPGKTWSGAVGGLFAAMGAGGTLAVLPDFAVPWTVMVVVSAGLSVVAQGGDLVESKIKRHFGVKDSSRLIPGHGGVLDRVDGVLAAAPVVAGSALISGGGIQSWGAWF
ncbi:MAG: phosphatidate cytidylyltransferase [Rhodospirillaceae bacterium]|nr:MAG: phosphatidate cytidylyltransferase [Rhodospirillaceae bacterium]